MQPGSRAAPSTAATAEVRARGGSARLAYDRKKPSQWRREHQGAEQHEKPERRRARRGGEHRDSVLLSDRNDQRPREYEGDRDENEKKYRTERESQQSLHQVTLLGGSDDVSCTDAPRDTLDLLAFCEMVRKGGFELPRGCPY
jgi:hypothetical protein